LAPPALVQKSAAMVRPDALEAGRKILARSELKMEQQQRISLTIPRDLRAQIEAERKAMS
jgi:hypothetical protein